MGGPATWWKAAGWSAVAPTDIGPMEVQAANGVVDILAENEADAVAQAKKLLGYFQGRLPDHASADQRQLRHVMPEPQARY